MYAKAMLSSDRHDCRVGQGKKITQRARTKCLSTMSGRSQCCLMQKQGLDQSADMYSFTQHT